MTANEIRTLVTDRGQAENLAADLFPLEGKCEGTPAECFLAGLWNACTMQDEENLIAKGDEKEFVKFCFSELDNMYPTR